MDAETLMMIGGKLARLDKIEVDLADVGMRLNSFVDRYGEFLQRHNTSQLSMAKEMNATHLAIARDLSELRGEFSVVRQEFHALSVQLKKSEIAINFQNEIAGNAQQNVNQQGGTAKQEPNHEPKQ